MFMHQSKKEQNNSMVKYRKCIMTWTSYAKKMDKISTSSTTIAGDFKTQRSRKGIDQKTALASVQEEEEMTVDSN